MEIRDIKFIMSIGVEIGRLTSQLNHLLDWKLKTEDKELIEFLNKQIKDIEHIADCLNEWVEEYFAE